MGHTPPDPVTWPAVTRTDLVRYASASGDFNPLHHDAGFARDAGLPDVMAHGMYSAGLMATTLEAWFGQGSLRRFAVRFRAPVWPGDLLTVRCDRIEGAPVAEIAASLLRAGGDVVMTAAATVVLPSASGVP